MSAAPKTLKLPAGVWALGVVSLFMDASSELIHSLLPVFLVGTLGASAVALGWVEGLAEGFASVLKLLSGAWSDVLRRRKTLLLLGYGLAAASKPLFPLAHSTLTVLAARLIDRTGKGIRGAPRDALITDITDPSQRGAAFGLRQSLDNIGAVAGPLLAIALMGLLAGDLRAVFTLAVIPAVLSVLVLLFFVREPARHGRASQRPRMELRALGDLPRAFWWAIAISTPFLLARFSEAFLLLRAQSGGLADRWVPLILVTMNIAYLASAYPAGSLSDRMPRTRLLFAGCLVMIAADLALAFGDTLPWIFAGAILWGLHMGLTEGLLTALVADTAPEGRSGTAFGVLHCQRGVLLLAASVLAGVLWEHMGHAATFIAGAAFAALSALLLLRPLPARP